MQQVDCPFCTLGLIDLPNGCIGECKYCNGVGYICFWGGEKVRNNILKMHGEVVEIKGKYIVTKEGEQNSLTETRIDLFLQEYTFIEKGREQRAEGIHPNSSCPNRLRDRREQGFKTRTPN